MNRQDFITSAFENRASIHAASPDPVLVETIDSVIQDLDSGDIRVAEKRSDGWHVNAWIKMAVLLYFRTHSNRVLEGGHTQYYDKVPLKFTDLDPDYYQKQGVRIVPPACARKGAYIARNTVLMPSYINIGAYIDEGTMIDTWATVGSCAQIGKNVHISGGVGIGGVLEPVQANPVIIEDNCFIGARSEIVEGVHIEEGAVLSMGVYLGQSTRIYHRQSGEISYGRIPRGAVVVPGSLPAKDNSHSLYCAVIVKEVDAKTREKVSLNELLRDVN